MEKWSDKFIINFEVPQGSILDAKLFDVVIDIMLDKLKVNMFGCHINESFMDSVACTDDIILLSSSVIQLQGMYVRIVFKIFVSNVTLNSVCKKPVAGVSGN